MSKASQRMRTALIPVFPLLMLLHPAGMRAQTPSSFASEVELTASSGVTLAQSVVFTPLPSPYQPARELLPAPPAPLFGGSAAVSVNRFMWLYVEGSHIRVGPANGGNGYPGSLVSSYLISQTVTQDLIPFHVGLRFQFGGDSRLQPYFDPGAGVLWVSTIEQQTIGLRFNGNGPSSGTSTTTSNLAPFSARLGGGFRVRIVNHWGIRASLDAIVGPRGYHFGIFSVGVFFQTTAP